MRKKLLIIDDDLGIRRMVGQLVKRNDWDFVEAATGEEGLTAAAAELPDMILLDIQLPDLAGWEVCRRLKESRSPNRIPIMMVSGQKLKPEEKAKGLELGADDYLVKPFDLSELWLRIEAILKARRG